MNRTLLLIIGFSISLLTTVAQDKPDPSFHLYILMGQSNMAGRGVVTEEFDVSNARVLMLDKNGQWVPAKHPLHFDKPKVAGVGPGLSFGIRMAEADPSIKIGLIPCAVGGTSIQHWKPGAYDAATKTHPWDDALVRIQKAMESGVIKGVLWHQGESDRSPEKASHYAEDLMQLIARVRDVVKDPELPFVMGELAPFLENEENINHELVKVSKEIPFTAVASAGGLEHKGDDVHFDSRSATVLGERFAERMRALER